MIIESSGWYHIPKGLKKTDYHYFQYPNNVSLCGGIDANYRHLTKGYKGNIRNFEKRKCNVCSEMYLKLDKKFRYIKNSLKTRPTPILLSELREPENRWQYGVCSKCGAPGVFWDGGKRPEHYCNECLAVTAT